MYVLISIGLLTACGGPTNTPPRNNAKNPPTVTLNSSNNSGTAPLTVTFTASGIPGSNETLAYSWDFGDGNTATNGVTRTHTFQKAGTFTTTVTVNGIHGSAKATRVIAVNTAIEPEPEPTTPYDGRAHLGEWVWAAVTTSGREDYGTVNYTVYDGALTAESREMIHGTWTDCYSAGCVTYPLARMGELHISTGWEQSFAFYGHTGTIRVLGFDLEPYTTSDGSIGYSGLAESWGSPAGIAIARVGPAALSTLSAGFNALASEYPDADWSIPEDLTTAFERISDERSD